MPLPLAAALGIGAASGLVSSVGNMISNQQQVKQAKELYDYQQERYLSPAAQVRNTTAAGLNPAQMFGNTAPVNVGGQMALPDAQPYGLHVGTQSLSEIANMMVGIANSKKAGVDTTNVEQQTEGVILDNERKRMENDFMSRYGLEKSAAELALAKQQVELAMASTDVQKQEKAKKNWEIAKEKALSECQEAQRDILRKELDNTDERLRLQNQKMEEEAKTERSKQSANYAGAEASKAAASNYREQAETTKSLRPHQIDAAQLENGLKAVDFDVKSATADLSKQEFIERVLNLMSQNRTGKAWTAMFGTSEVSPNDVELGSMYKAANALWEKYKQGVKQGIDKVNSHKNK